MTRLHLDLTFAGHWRSCCSTFSSNRGAVNSGPACRPVSVYPTRKATSDLLLKERQRVLLAHNIWTLAGLTEPVTLFKELSEDAQTPTPSPPASLKPSVTLIDPISMPPKPPPPQPTLLSYGPHAANDAQHDINPLPTLNRPGWRRPQMTPITVISSHAPVDNSSCNLGFKIQHKTLNIS